MERLEWLVGGWSGSKGDDPIEEHWMPPAGGVMIGMFRYIRDDAVRFSEHLQIRSDGEAVLMEIKHFGPDFIGWEEKDSYVRFQLVEGREGYARFQLVDTEKAPLWLIYESPSVNELEAYFLKEGSAPSDDRFRYRRS